MLYIQAGVIHPPAKAPFFDRIHHIFQAVSDVMSEYQPQELAIEEIFLANNVKSSLKLGHARGAVLIAAVEAGLRIFEYSPLEIKKSTVGYGRASKEQVRSMVKTILNLKTEPLLDASDALAAAICHLNWKRF
jgi:crossover junction endodeoxyribonuclease RuvC